MNKNKFQFSVNTIGSSAEIGDLQLISTFFFSILGFTILNKMIKDLCFHPQIAMDTFLVLLQFKDMR